MKALSIDPEYAMKIARGEKTIECRSWTTKYHGDIVICSSAKKVFSVADGYLIACFDNDVKEDVVIEIAKKHPFYAVFRDSSMASDSVAANVEQIFETYSPQTVRKVL